jgi:hypothetical protein
MGKFEKALAKILSGASDNNFGFDDLKYILLHFNLLKEQPVAVIEYFLKKALRKS